MANIYKGTLGLIGNTPLVEVENIEKELNLPATLLVKLEYLNPAGSVKDRIAKAMIDKSRKEHKDSYTEFYTTECGVFIETYGRRATQRFIDFLYKEKISDLHTGNYGYDALGNLKIIDYSGFHDLDVF